MPVTATYPTVPPHKQYQMASKTEKRQRRQVLSAAGRGERTQSLVRHSFETCAHLQIEARHSYFRHFRALPHLTVTGTNDSDSDNYDMKMNLLTQKSQRSQLLAKAGRDKNTQPFVRHT